VLTFLEIWGVQTFLENGQVWMIRITRKITISDMANRLNYREFFCSVSDIHLLPQATKHKLEGREL